MFRYVLVDGESRILLGLHGDADSQNLAKLGLSGKPSLLVLYHSNYFDEHGLFVVPQTSLQLKSILTRRNVQRACSAVVFDEFISHGK